MDIYGLKNYIINNPHYIELVLEKAGFWYIEDNDKRNEVRCARQEGRNPTSVRVNKTTLSATCFSTNLKGDLITLVQSKLNTTFHQTIKKITELVNFKHEVQEEYKLPFGGFYKKISKLRSDDELDIEIYSEDILNRFESIPNMLFYEDGILPQVQLKYNIGYDSVSRRITVPWYALDGSGLCGVMGRLNKRDVEDDENKWYPIIPFPKSKTIYGYVENYNNIQEKGIVMLGESEKHTLALSSKGLDVGLSLGGSFLSDTQANHIKSMFPNTIIVMMDEGLERDHSHDIAAKLKSDKFYKNKVGYIYDKNNLYLPKDSKLAPADMDKSTINKLIKQCTVWI